MNLIALFSMLCQQLHQGSRQVIVQALKIKGQFFYEPRSVK